MPAISQGDDWLAPRQQPSRTALAQDRQQVQPSRSNRALAACHVFRRDALLVDSECDDTMAQPAIESDRSAFSAAR